MNISDSLLDPVNVHELLAVLEWITARIINPHEDEEDPYYPYETIQLKPCTMGELNLMYGKVLGIQLMLEDALRRK